MVLEFGGQRFAAQGFAIKRDANYAALQQHYRRGRQSSESDLARRWHRSRRVFGQS
jgi:hypothetical protein